MKYCTDCKTTRNKSKFQTSSATKDGLQKICRACMARRQADWYKRNKKYHNSRGKAYGLKYKETVLSQYCNGKLKCACCGEKRIEFLTLDHVHGGGTAHRREIKRNHSNRIYWFLIKNNFPDKDKYRVLCTNCNCSIGLYGYCPHKVTFVAPESKLMARTEARHKLLETIKNEYKTGKYTYSDLSSKFGVSSGTIWFALKHHGQNSVNNKNSKK